MLPRRGLGSELATSKVHFIFRMLQQQVKHCFSEAFLESHQPPCPVRNALEALFQCPKESLVLGQGVMY